MNKNTLQNLTVIGYILPSLEEQLIIKHIESYGRDFWNLVSSRLVFKNNISDHFKQFLDSYDIRHESNVNEFWISNIESAVRGATTDYIEIFIEDKLVVDSKQLIHSLETMQLNDADFMPPFYYFYWNMLADYMKSHGEVESNEEFSLMQWGTSHSIFCKKTNFKKHIQGLKGDPFPLSTGGIYKKTFLLNTLTTIINSDYWKKVQENPQYFEAEDWAKNPFLPHSHEVWWKHNEDRENLLYNVLIPKMVHTITNDPKNIGRFHLQ